MHDTLLSDIDGSIYWWYFFYCVSNGALVTASVIVVGLPVLTAAGVFSPKWGGAITAVFGALLAYLGLSGVSTSFITARNDLQIAKYRYYSDKDPTAKDRETLIAAYEKAKTLAAYIQPPPRPPNKGRSEPPMGPPPRNLDRQAPRKSDAPASQK